MIRRSIAPAVPPAGPGDREAFTLIELLVVVAIIAILSALLIPAVVRAKESARSALCSANLHQISLGIQMYVDDTKYYPQYVSWTGDPSSPGQRWPEGIEPYTGQNWTNKLYECPSYQGPRMMRGETPLGSYGYNGWNIVILPYPSTWALGGPEVTPVSESEVSVPSDMIELGDSTYSPLPNFNIGPGGPMVVGIGSFTKWQCFFHFFRSQQEEVLRLVKKRHGGRYNVAFCDGHAERIEYKRLYDRNGISLRRWNRDHEPHLDEPKP